MFEDIDLKITEEKIVIPGIDPQIVKTNKFVCGGTATCTAKVCC